MVSALGARNAEENPLLDLSLVGVSETQAS